MLRTNLSTRPFYNERGVYAVVLAIAAVALVVTIFNVSRIFLLSREQGEYGRRAAVAENMARSLRAHAVQVRQGIDAKQLDAISGAAHEVNTIVAQRLFSWTDLLNRLETTLPEDVRISSMRPRIDRDESVTILMNVVGRRVEDVNEFMKRLEATGAFSDVFSGEETTSEDGSLRATIQGRYSPPDGTPPAATP